jgi:hypothetical protein
MMRGAQHCQAVTLSKLNGGLFKTVGVILTKARCEANGLSRPLALAGGTLRLAARLEVQ